MKLLLVLLSFVASNAQAKNLDSDVRTKSVVMVCNNTGSHREVTIGKKCRVAKEVSKSETKYTRKSQD